MKFVVAASPRYRVVTRAGEDNVVAGAPGHALTRRGAHQEIVSGRTGQPFGEKHRPASRELNRFGNQYGPQILVLDDQFAIPVRIDLQVVANTFRRPIQ